MLRIISSEGNFDWYKGLETPIPIEDINAIEAVMADGQELQDILSKVYGIRHIDWLDRQVDKVEEFPVQWFGDDAKFIVANYVWYEQYKLREGIIK